MFLNNRGLSDRAALAVNLGTPHGITARKRKPAHLVEPKSIGAEPEKFVAFLDKCGVTADSVKLTNRFAVLGEFGLITVEESRPLVQLLRLTGGDLRKPANDRSSPRRPHSNGSTHGEVCIMVSMSAQKI